MALVEGKLYNCSTYPQDMWWYLSTYSQTPPAAGSKVGACQAGANMMYAITLPAQIYKVWLPNVGGGKWATRSPDNLLTVTEPYTNGNWRAPGNAPEPQGVDNVTPPADPDNYCVDLVFRFKKENGRECEPMIFTRTVTEDCDKQE